MRIAVLLAATALSLPAQILYNRAELVNAAAARLHTDGDYAALSVLAHELGHAVAHRLGDLEIFADRRENAADCMAGSATRGAANARVLEAGDFEEAIFAMNLAGQGGSRSPLFDQDTHGSPEERVLNFRQGYEKGWRTCGLLELRMQQLPPARR